MAKQKVRRPRSEVQKFVDLLENEMPTDHEWIFGGSWRRGANTVGDLDVMIVTENGLFNDFRFPSSFTTVRQGPQIRNGLLSLNNDPVDSIGCDFWSCKPEQRGAFLVFITGPAALNIYQRQCALKLGFTLSQYGLFNHNQDLIPCWSEQDVYERLGLKWLEPFEREQFVERPPETEAKWDEWDVDSDSGNGAYRVRHKGGFWDCTCFGFKYCRKIPRTCKHIERKKAEIQV